MLFCVFLRINLLSCLSVSSFQLLWDYFSIFHGVCNASQVLQKSNVTSSSEKGCQIPCPTLNMQWHYGEHESMVMPDSPGTPATCNSCQLPTWDTVGVKATNDRATLHGYPRHWGCSFPGPAPQLSRSVSACGCFPAVVWVGNVSLDSLDFKLAVLLQTPGPICSKVWLPATSRQWGRMCASVSVGEEQKRRKPPSGFVLAELSQDRK